MESKAQPDINKQLKRTVKDSLVYLPARIIPAVIGIILIRILTTAFSQEEYGHYQIALSTFGLIRVFSAIWLSTSVTRFFLNHKKSNQQSEFFTTLFICSILSTISIAVVSWVINITIFKSRLEPALFSLINLAIAASIFNSIFEIFVIVFRAGLEPKKYSLFWILFSIGKPLIGVGLILLFNFKGDGIFWGFLIVPLILNLIIFSKLNLYKHLKFSLFLKPIYKQFAKYGIPISFSFLSFWILSLSDRYLLKIFQGSAEVGLYSVGYAISEKTLNFLYTVLMLAAFPIIIDNWEKYGQKHTQNLISELTRYFLILCVPVLVVLVTVPRQVLQILSDTKFIEGANVLPIIAIGIFLLGLTQYVLKGFELHKKSIKIAMLALGAGTTNILLNIYLIPRFGYFGAGISACVAYGVYFISAVIFVRKDMAWIPPYRSFVNVFMAGILMSLILKLCSTFIENIFILILLIAPFAFLIFLVTLIVIREINSHEIKKAWNFAVSLIKG